MLCVKNLTKVYKTKKAKDVVALDNVSIDFPETGLVFLLGKSGSGKSTLLNCIGGLDKFNSGEVIIKGKSSKNFKQSDFDSYRNTFIGFIFQEYNILEEFSVGKNLALALELQGKKASHSEVVRLLKEVEMDAFENRKPNQLSGGQKQRVAIARALIKDPKIIMADEPTGALDSNTGAQVMETLKLLSKNRLVIIVSHDREFAELYGDRIVELKDGRILRDVTKHEVEPKKTKSGINIIDEKIVHIKKGQEINKEDILAIAKLIVENSKKEDTIISFDKTSNDEVKKAAFITDEGKREVFNKTETTDIRLKQYNANDLHLIKSKMKFKDSFKMGASALNKKPIRLLFTIFLSFVAFCMFGLIDTFVSFNRPQVVWSTILHSNQTNLTLVKENPNSNSYSKNELIQTNDIYDINKLYPDYELTGVISCNGSLQIDGKLVSNGSGIYSGNISGITCFSQQQINDYGFSIVEGRLPTIEGEIAISKNLYDTCIKNDSSISNFSNINSISGYIGDIRFNSIVGVIDDKTDVSKYKNIKSTELNTDYNLQNEIRSLLRYGFVNMCYVSANELNSIAKSGNDVDYRLIVNDINMGYLFPKFSQISNQLSGSVPVQTIVKYYKGHPTGVYSASDIVLAKNEVMIESHYLTNFGSEEEIYEAIENGTLKIYAGKEYGSNPKQLTEALTVVGIMNSGSGSGCSLLCSEETKNKVIAPIYSGYGYVVTRLTGNRAKDESFVKFCEKTNADGFKYAIQNRSTDVLDSFESLITSMAEVFLYIGIVFAVFASLMLMNFIATSISQKKREIGVLRAIGARGYDVFKIFFSESFIIAFINFVLASAGTFIVAGILNNLFIKKLGVQLILLSAGVRQIILIFAISILAAFIASVLPVVKIARKNPIDAINNR